MKKNLEALIKNQQNPQDWFYITTIFSNYKVKLNNLNFQDKNSIKINYFSHNIDEVKNIALNGWKKGHDKYNEKIITNYMLHKAFNKNIEITWPEVTYS